MNVKLCYCIGDKPKIILEENSKEEIDKLTTKYEDSKELRKKYQNQITTYQKEQQEYINAIEKKISRKETGDIVLINHKNQRIRVLYNKHVIIFNEIIEINKFYEYLAINYPGYIDALEQYIIKDFYKIVRNVYEIYKATYEQLRLPSPERIYTKYKLQQTKTQIEEDFTGSLLDIQQKVKKTGGNKNDGKNNM